MKIILLMLICTLGSSANSPLIEANPPTKVETFKPTMVTNRKVSITFTGTVKSIELLGERKLKVIPVNFDSRFAVTVHIESVTPLETPLKEGAEAIFAIHSPARLFLAGEKDVVGKKYRFRLTWEKVNDRSRFSQLTASPIKDNETRQK
jgi:hypothetical protein